MLGGVKMELKWSQDKSICTCFACWWCGQTEGGALERVQISVLAEELNIDFFFFFCGR